jgi:hypothetical protein
MYFRVLKDIRSSRENLEATECISWAILARKQQTSTSTDGRQEVNFAIWIDRLENSQNTHLAVDGHTQTRFEFVVFAQSIPESRKSKLQVVDDGSNSISLDDQFGFSVGK